MSFHGTGSRYSRSMIVFGTCVGGSGERYRRDALPSIHRAAAADDLVLSQSGDAGISVVYNSFIDEARSRPDCQALVLLHDDVEIADRNFRAKVCRATGAAGVGVVGVVGGAGLRSLEWWRAHRTAGRVFETRRVMDLGDRRTEVDAVDGLLLIISPRAFKKVRFDEQTFSRFHGYDVDYCLAVKHAGFRVCVVPIDVLHRTKGGYGTRSDFDRADAALRRKWPQYLGKPRVTESVRAVVSRRAPKALRAGSRACSMIRQLAQNAYDRHGLAEAMSRKAGVEVPDARAARLRTEWLQSYVLRGSVLEIGSGAGAFLAAAERAGFDTYGVESDVRQVSLARSAGLEVLHGQFADWAQEFGTHHVDLVVLWQPPMDDALPVGLLRDVRSLLPRGGQLFVELWNRMAETDRGLEACPQHGQASRTEAFIRSDLTRAGFEVVLVQPMSSDLYLSTDDRLARRNDALLERRPWPVNDKVRVVAKVP